MTDTSSHQTSFLLKSLEAADLEPAFRLATRVFAKSSTLHRALGIQLDEYRDYLWPSFLAMASEELSVIAVDPIRRQTIGCLIAADFHRNTVMPEADQTSKFAPLVDLTSELVRAYRKRRHLNDGDAVLVDMGAVTPEASGIGVYKSMRQGINRIAQNRGFRFIVGELSSEATQHVVINQMGHRRMAEVRFADFKTQGSRPFASITAPASIVLSEGDLV